MNTTICFYCKKKPFLFYELVFIFSYFLKSKNFQLEYLLFSKKSSNIKMSNKSNAKHILFNQSTTFIKNKNIGKEPYKVPYNGENTVFFF